MLSVLNFSYSAQMCLFYLFHHIQSSGDINFKDIKLKKKDIFIINT